jgi:hypothetical protein
MIVRYAPGEGQAPSADRTSVDREPITPIHHATAVNTRSVSVMSYRDSVIQCEESSVSD